MDRVINGDRSTFQRRFPSGLNGEQAPNINGLERVFNRKWQIVNGLYLPENNLQFYADLWHPEQQGQTIPAANADIVEAGGYLAHNPGGGTSGVGVANTSVYRLFNNNESRIRQNGNVHHFTLYLANVTNVTNLYIQIWRKDGATWDRVYQEDVLAQVTGVPGVVTLTPSTTWTVQEGDYLGLGIHVTEAGAGTPQLRATAGQVANSAYYVYDATPGDTDYDWSAQTASTAVVPLKVFMQAPQVVFIGDSLTQGATEHSSFIMNVVEDNIPSSMPYQFGQVAGCTYQNMGIGSQSAVEEAARFAADVVALKPKIAVIWPFVNNDYGDEPAWLTAMTSMLDACATNGIIPWLIFSSALTTRSAANWVITETWEADLLSLLASYSGVKVFHPRKSIGMFRAGEAAGNLWDLKTIYDSGDGVHPNQAGYTVIGKYLADPIIDRSTNAYNLVNFGAEWSSTGRILTGTEDISVNVNDSLKNLNDITVLVWHKSPLPTSPGYLCAHYDTTANLRKWAMFSSANGGGYSRLGVSLSTNGSAVGKSYTSSIVNNNNTWKLAGFTFAAAASELKLYINGVLDTNPTKTADTAITSLYASSANLEIGCLLANAAKGGFLIGTEGEVYIWGQVLSIQEINQIYQSTRWRYGV